MTKVSTVIEIIRTRLIEELPQRIEGADVPGAKMSAPTFRQQVTAAFEEIAEEELGLHFPLVEPVLNLHTYFITSRDLLVTTLIKKVSPGDVSILLSRSALYPLATPYLNPAKLTPVEDLELEDLQEERNQRVAANKLNYLTQVLNGVDLITRKVARDLQESSYTLSDVPSHLLEAMDPVRSPLDYLDSYLIGAELEEEEN